MRKQNSGLSITKKFLIFIFFLFVVNGTSAFLFMEKSKEAGTYDDLNFRLHDIKFTMVKLEYTLDMFLVARHFEQEKIELIPEDVRKLDTVLRELEAQAYTTFSANSPISVGIKFLADDWRVMKNDFSRLNTALSYDVVLLLHNAIDMNMFLFYEKTDKLLNDVDKGRQRAFRDIKVLVYRVLALTFLLVIVAAFVFVVGAFYPIKAIADGARRVLNGEYNFPFREGLSGEAGDIAAALNLLENSVNDSHIHIEKKTGEFSVKMENLRKSVEALTELANVAGESLSQKDIYMSAINICILNTGAAAAAIYLLDDKGALTFQASSAVGGSFGDEVAVIPPGERLAVWADGTSELVLKDIDEYPDSQLKSSLLQRRYSAVLSYPIPYNKTVVGVVLLIFNEPDSFISSSAPFLKAVASFVGATTGHINFFYEEHAKKNFLDSIVQQSPLGTAVFNSEGHALMLNATLKRMLGVRKDEDFVGKYKLFEDNIFDSNGLFDMFRESFEGHMNEAQVRYDPCALTWYDFEGSPMNLRIKSFPIYDASGEISTIALIYEDQADVPDRTQLRGRDY